MTELSRLSEPSQLAQNPDGHPQRLSPAQWQIAQQKAIRFRQQVEQEGQGLGFPEVFRLAARRIQADVDTFYDRALETFDEIDAFGKEPQLDSDWLCEVTGEKDSFSFSTDSLLSLAEPLPRRKRGRKPQPHLENDVVRAVQQAIAQAEDAFSVAHLEDPADWILKIVTALQLNHGVADFEHLRLATGLSPAALLLGLLLGHDSWTLHQAQFYAPITVTLIM